MFKIIAEYLINRRVNSFFQEVENCTVSGKMIPDNCFAIKFWRCSVNFTEEGIFVNHKTLKKISYIGKELTLEELKEKYGSNSEYDIFIENVERNNLQVVVDKMEKLHIIEDADSDTEIEVILI